MSYILISPLYFFFGGGFLKSHFYLFFLAGSFQSHLFFDRLFSKPPFDRLFSEPSFSFCPPQVAHTGLPHHLKKKYYAYNTEQDTTSLRDDVQLSREVPFTYISPNFIIFSILQVHTGTASSRKAWTYLKKGMVVQETYQETTETL